MDSRNQFQNEARFSDIVWVSEIHGVSQNYQVYRHLIPILRKIGYTSVALEYPSDLNGEFNENKFSKYQNIQDGRFSQESLDFFRWLDLQEINRGCFDISSPADQQNREYLMAQNLMSLFHKEKTLVISGGFHSQKRLQRINDHDILPQSGVVEQVTSKKIVRIGIKYLAGQFYNFSLKKLTSEMKSYDELKLNFGDISRNIDASLDENWWIHSGPATPIHLLNQ
ncbi:hypothetical protein A3D85_03050 [Candidatus Amesbacteria bacterium RIFCSPHIGHO2_02_FULL_47_9]|uniref:Haem-binding uptake Tiki superfamily ChaN domain-containing protein n=1 Tax=Candidatus Amesbacteria bacterium RIFCSPHIGHO2_01_FULL_48_32b TaxID=1797253 RepID=A0A1F4YCP3_9BACT|nr:MAG: hypothetical protein A2876_03735 [Candidatus Amesbacteria bacterium RIFCSPHIGHO2_01_FULL_48_32b]OGD04878.1 MAG: hypothetical protein A3D85_03050 [Candidatus Amesbacteria bacterium RIFCSPHIGHO2_02_FULL_47_9]OGD06865.1 MAG: hypothetical protein A2899_03265 [Candidatus Amesbacteria bacterium RIFCSPLOWO2_01_FULL_49_25]